MSLSQSANWEIILDRAYAAPKSLVWRAWTDPEMLGKWLCPKDFVVTNVEVDLKIGGKWRSGMRSPEGIDYSMGGVYKTLDAPNRLVFTHAWEDDLASGHIPGHESLIEIDLNEFEGMTRMTFRVTGLTSEESRDGQKIGWSQAFENQGRALALESPNGELESRSLAFTRLYPHSRKRVWKAWTDPDALTQWWGPNGFTTTTYEMDVCSGGRWRFTMHGPDGRDYKNLVSYVAVDEPTFLAYQHSDDDEGDIHFFAEVHLTKEDMNTRLDFRMTFESIEILRRVVEEFGAEEGANQTLTRLADYLKENNS